MEETTLTDPRTIHYEYCWHFVNYRKVLDIERFTKFIHDSRNDLEKRFDNSEQTRYNFVHDDKGKIRLQFFRDKYTSRTMCEYVYMINPK